MINLTHNTQRTIFVIAITFFMVACGKSQESQQPVMPAMPVSVLEMQPTTVPIQTEAVAQTEGAKEVEVRPRVGGILLKKLFAEGEEIKEGQPMFSIDPVPYQTQVSQANAQLAQKKHV